MIGFRLPMSVLATIGKGLNGKLNAKIDLPIGHFMLLADAGIESQILHTFLINILITHWLDVYKILRVRTIQNFELLDKNWLTLFTNI